MLDDDRLFVLPSGKFITGTLVWYFAICKREVWLMSRNIKPDEDHQSLQIGRVVHDSFYDRMKQEVEAEGMKVDILNTNEGAIYEVKTSSKFLEATKLQLAYYLVRFEQMGVKVKGIIAVPRERKRIPVVLTDELREVVHDILKEIAEICEKPMPPPPVKINFCRRCAYRDFCWSESV